MSAREVRQGRSADKDPLVPGYLRQRPRRLPAPCHRNLRSSAVNFSICSNTLIVVFLSCVLAIIMLVAIDVVTPPLDCRELLSTSLDCLSSSVPILASGPAGLSGQHRHDSHLCHCPHRVIVIVINCFNSDITIVISRTAITSTSLPSS